MSFYKGIHHFITITKHRHCVIANCFRAGIPIQGLLHDLSKYSPTEFREGIMYYQGTRSPNEGAREENGYSLAWMHHKGRNKHHFEYWTDYSKVSHMPEPVPMPYKYVAEMFCDRVAASKIYQGSKYTDKSALEYYTDRRKMRRIHPQTAAELEILLNMLADKGEDYTFRYIRTKLKENKKK